MKFPDVEHILRYLPTTYEHSNMFGSKVREGLRNPPHPSFEQPKKTLAGIGLR